MQTYLATAPANCHTGTWLQQWKCGWDQPTTATARAGYEFGHNAVPVLILLAVILFVAVAVRKRSSGRSITAR